MRNVTGAPVTGDDLYGRRDEINRLWARLDHGEHLLMLAPRRVGKTSLMLELARDPRAGWDVVYINVEAADSAADLLARVYAALLQHPRYRTWLKLGWSQVTSALDKVKHAKAMGVEIKRTLGRDWVRAADRLERQLERQSDGRRLLIVIDELPILIARMLDSGDRAEEASLLLAKLRQWRQAPGLRGKVQTLVGGSVGLEGVLRRAGLSAYINDVTPFRVTAWSRSTAASFLKRVGEENQFPLTDHWTNRILDLLGELVPYHVQLFFAALHDTCATSSDLSELLVEQCFEERLTGAGGTPHLDHYAARLEVAFGQTQHEIALRILARASRFERGLLRSELAGDDSASDLGQVLQTLESDGYLHGQEDRLAFQSNLLRVWWRKHRGGAS